METASKPIFIHCRHGQDRTGLVVACWRIEKYGWINKQALDEAKFYNINWLQFGMKHFIKHYVSYRLKPLN
jgi:protein tyrosine/serine phosphatase